MLWLESCHILLSSSRVVCVENDEVHYATAHELQDGVVVAAQDAVEQVVVTFYQNNH